MESHPRDESSRRRKSGPFAIILASVLVALMIAGFLFTSESRIVAQASGLKIGQSEAEVIAILGQPDVKTMFFGRRGDDHRADLRSSVETTTILDGFVPEAHRDTGDSPHFVVPGGHRPR